MNIATAASGAPIVPTWVRLQRADNPGPMTLDGTNTWVISTGADDRVIVVDPGPADDDHLRAIADHGDVTAILLTHGHRDHSDGVDALHRMTKAPVLAFDARWLRGTEPLRDQDELSLAALELDVLHTPGHSSDSLTFVARRDGQRVIITGDTILGRGSTVVEFPDGRLGDYLASLERIGAHGDTVVLPGHGPVGSSASRRAHELLRHRRERLAQIEAAWHDGFRHVDALTARVYADAPADVQWAARLNVEAQLDYLRTSGRLTS
jgi:glyoxylase-like metal-dependent hydrolase (beta-lactamase superfamily II)